MSFEQFNLEASLMKAVLAQGFEAPTKIQESVIPHIMQGQDVMASAETGAGKTLAFILPILNRLLSSQPKGNGHGPRALILAPTRELADQINKEILKMAKHTSLKFGTITGGVAYGPQEFLLRKPLDILVATPGRLIDHMEKGRVDLSRIELFILDEADRMLDMGFMKDIEKIFNPLPSDRQILLFSATLEGEVLKIANRFLKDPQEIKLTSRSTSSSLITQIMHPVNNTAHKRAVLAHILEDAQVWQAIVFTATKRAAVELADDLSDLDISCAELHGDMKQAKRARTINDLRQGKFRVLVATDVAARGLDVQDLSHVINYDMPKSGEDYIHRIGRTGRAGKTGTAISLVSPRDNRLLAQVERFIGKRLQRVQVAHIAQFKDETRTAKNDNRWEENNNQQERNDNRRERYQRNDNRGERTEKRFESKRPRNDDRREGKSAREDGARKQWPGKKRFSENREARGGENRRSTWSRGNNEGRGFQENRGYKEKRENNENRGNREGRGDRENRRSFSTRGNNENRGYQENKEKRGNNEGRRFPENKWIKEKRANKEEIGNKGAKGNNENKKYFEGKSRVKGKEYFKDGKDKPWKKKREKTNSSAD